MSDSPGKHTPRTNRRQFLSTTTKAVAASTLGVPTFISRRALAAPGRPGANDRIRVGAIGVGGRAKLLLEQLPEGGEIVALSDCNVPRAEAFKTIGRRQLARVSGLSQDAGPQGHRRGDRGHRRISAGACPASTPARPAKTSMPRSRSRSTSAKAARWSTPCGSYDRVFAGRHAAALDGDEPRGLRAGAQRRAGQGAGSPGHQLLWGRGFARCRTRPDSPCPRGSIGTCGSTRRPSGRSIRTGWAGCGGGISPAAR